MEKVITQIQVGNDTFYTYNKQKQVIKVWEVIVGDCDSVYIDNDGNSYSPSRVFDSVEELKQYWRW